jgi:SAM-dependent methyltransferase
VSEAARRLAKGETRQKRPPSEHAFDAVASLYDSWYDTPLGQTVDELEKDLLYPLAGLRSVSPRARLRSVSPGARLQGGQQALDVGTGTGHFAVDLAARGLSVIGVDLSTQMLTVARESATAMHLVRGDAARLPMASESFDLVLSVTALEFAADPERAVQEMWRVVRPGGRLVVGVLNAWSPWAWQRRRESRGQQTPFSHAHFFSPAEFLELLRQLGPVQWSSSVFVGPNGEALRWAWTLERLGRALLKPFGALLVGRVSK